MTCRNCGAELTGEFCAACGQRAIDPDPTLRELGHELAEEFLHWDGKLATTFRLLVTRPGALTTEYLAGRRIRYISPLRIYLTCSVLFFFASSIVPKPPIVIRTGGGVQTQVGPISIGQSDSTLAMAALDTLAQQGHGVGRLWGKHFGNALRHRAELSGAVTAAVPKTMFVLVPLFAALVALAFRSRRQRYPQHLAFALHVHAFLFLALTVMLLRRVTTILPVIVGVQLLVLGAIAVYFVKAIRVVYGGSRRAAVLRATGIAGTYFIAFLFAMLLMFGAIVLVEF
jgi:hypothetical protein